MKIVGLDSFEVMESKENHRGSVRYVAYSEIDNRVFTAGFDQNILVWTYKTN